MNKTTYIYMHADDFGMTPSSSDRILKCLQEGCLNSVSIMPNGCLELIKECLTNTELDCAVHVNLVEGKTVYLAEELDLLVDKEGYMNNTFFPLLIKSLIPGKRKRLEQQIYNEISAQIQAVLEILPEGTEVMIDSHQHVHMIPLVFKTLLRVILDYNIQVKYFRIPAEPWGPFFKEPSLYCTYKPVNIVKNLVLNFLWLFEKSAFKRTGIQTALFCGILFSGNMDEQRVAKVFPHFYKMAKKKNCDLEFLFHPGYIKQDEVFLDPSKESFKAFYLSGGRKAEQDALCSNKIEKMIREANQ